MPCIITFYCTYTEHINYYTTLLCLTLLLLYRDTLVILDHQGKRDPQDQRYDAYAYMLYGYTKCVFG